MKGGGGWFIWIKQSIFYVHKFILGNPKKRLVLRQCLCSKHENVVASRRQVHMRKHMYCSSLVATLRLSSDCRAFIEYLDSKTFPSGNISKYPVAPVGQLKK